MPNIGRFFRHMTDRFAVARAMQCEGITPFGTCGGPAMQLHLGRLVDHIHLRARDLEATKRFYKAVLGALGIPVGTESADHISFDELWIDALKGEEGSATHVHLAFQAADGDAVARFHAAGLAAGGRDNGKPGERKYHPGYYAAFLIDPDGNNVEAVHHGPARRSAASVVIDA